MEDEKEQTTECNIPIYMSKELELKLKYLSSEFGKEVGGWLTGEFKDNGVYVDDLLMPEQEVSGASVDIDATAGPKLLKEFKDKCKKIVGHWHSHVGMGCFWSATDETNMEEIMEPREKYVFIVSSKGEHLVRIETKVPFRMSINNLKYVVLDEQYVKIGLKMEKELKKKIKETVTSTIPYNRYPGDGTTTRNWFGNQSTPSYEEEINYGIKASYEKRELIISGLTEDEKEFLLGMYKCRRAEEVKPVVNGLHKIMIRVSGLTASQKLMEDIKTNIAEFGIDSLPPEDEFSTDKDLREYQEQEKND